MIKFLIRLPAWVLTGIIVTLIAYLTLVPRPLPDVDIKLFPGVDKVVHAIMFGALSGAILLDWSRRRSFKSLTLMIGGIAFVVSSLAGGLIELLQGAMGLGRGCDQWDFAADCVGAFIGVSVSYFLIKFLKARSDCHS